jgi:hypothetical protein
MSPHLTKVAEAIREAESKGMLKENPILTGFSGKKMMGALQRFAAEFTDEKNCYLEVGVFQGLTLLSVGSVAKGDVFGIDNFAFFDKDGKNQSIVEDRRSKLGLDNVHLINADYEDALHALEKHLNGRKISVYFVDGPHDYRSQLVCLLFAKPFLSENAVIVVDDSNYNDVRQATADFLVSHPEYKLFYQAYTACHPINMDKKTEEEARNGWWDGINVIVRDKNNELKAEYPSTIRSRKLFEADQNTHSARFPEAAYIGIKLAEAYDRFWVRGIIKFNLELIRGFSQKKKKKPSYFELNTHSHDLPKGQFNSSVSE